MITSVQIAEIIKNPDLAGSYPLSDLTELRDKFSYCSTLHLICLKAQSLEQNLDFDRQLRFAAAHVMDRERMYYLIHSEQAEVLPEIQTTSAEDPKKQEEQVSQEALEEPVVETVERQEVPDTISDSSTEISAEEAPDSSDVQVQKSVDLLETAPDLIQLVYETELSAAEEETVESPVAEIKATTGAVPEESVNKYENQEDEESTAPLETTEPIHKGDLSFTEWLRSRSRKESPLKNTEPEVQIPEKESSEVLAQPEVEIQKSPKQGLSRSQVDALLNKFISEEPSISKPKTAFFSPTRNARQSVEESEDLVTETLAKIYFLQKNYGKAIQAYEQLSLVYPEKKVFFATQIEKIKDEQFKNSSK